MTVTRFALDAIAPTPWKNGGGTTREIAVWPPGAGMDTFDWRISVADIATDGPFSAFPGIDRQIVLIDGAGVHLQAHDDSFCHKLVRVGEPFAFSGDTAIHAALVDGPTRDFNVMTRRGRCRAEVRLMRQPFTAVPGDATVLVLALRGDWDASDSRSGDSQHLSAGEGMLMPASSPAVTLSHTALSALCLRVTLLREQYR
ncbi:HutD/Ves family protein [Cupriavidus pauculus]|uniref:Histidine utilization protein HutD n=1 Tax=Cupriavidus pauculus TaxID=82633 RepID=A0A2N5CGW1_9BURK|nr:HutD family protein [Cupriavidus pauculus]PLQ01452.1 histidine utilization protein HutD [Cupriavidus pauculus]